MSRVLEALPYLLIFFLLLGFLVIILAMAEAGSDD